MDNIAQEIADKIWQAGLDRRAISPIREVIGITDLEMAYRIQRINNERKIAAGARVLGAKIGLTSPAVQQQLGVDQPDFGLLLTGMEIPDGGLCPSDELMQPKAEAEIAFVLSADIAELESTDPLAPAGADAAAVAAAVEYAQASIEIVGSRIANWDIKITDTIADNASASHYVLGAKQAGLDGLDLAACKMQLTKNGNLASEGSGAACMGSPLNAAVWLARTMIRLGSPLKAGEVILTGALGPMVPLEVGDEIETTIEGLGSVRVTIK